MLTVDYDRLGVAAGDRLLDLGAGGGRHAFEASRRGARVVALDADAAELKDVGGTFAAMGATDVGAVNGDALALPFPDASFDRVIAAEVREHIPEDRTAMGELVRVLRPGGTIAVTVPRWFPELVNWALSDEYHNVPGGHIRIYRHSTLVGRLRDAGLRYRGTGFAHGLHSPYWWLKCAVGVRNNDHPLVKAYHRLLVWDIEKAPVATRLPEAILGPVIGKSVVVYAEKPLDGCAEKAA
ncbi:MAG: class I SAM-dependent methyltransferase [Actinobacteria bacterium]|nr:class I SAM-dependent methyltransferase [Actinomycetota bacterium]